MGLGKTIEILSLIHVNRPTFPLSPTTSTPSHITSPTTLIICPMSLLAQWRDEILRGSAPGSLTVDVYYGGSKDRHLRESCIRWDGRAPDVVVTSYGTVMSEWCAEMGERKEGVFGIEWWRIVLDEAHQIKARMTKTARSCFALAAQRRWVVTGTPIQVGIALAFITLQNNQALFIIASAPNDLQRRLSFYFKLLTEQARGPFFSRAFPPGGALVQLYFLAHPHLYPLPVKGRPCSQRRPNCSRTPRPPPHQSHEGRRRQRIGQTAREDD